MENKKEKKKCLKNKHEDQVGAVSGGGKGGAIYRTTYQAVGEHGAGEIEGRAPWGFNKPPKIAMRRRSRRRVRRIKSHKIVK